MLTRGHTADLRTEPKSAVFLKFVLGNLLPPIAPVTQLVASQRLLDVRALVSADIVAVSSALGLYTFCTCYTDEWEPVTNIVLPFVEGGTFSSFFIIRCNMFPKKQV